MGFWDGFRSMFGGASSGIAAFVIAVSGLIPAKPAEAYTPQTTRAVIEVFRSSVKLEQDQNNQNLKIKFTSDLSVLTASVTADHMRLMKKIKENPSVVTQKEINDVRDGLILVRGISEKAEGYGERLRTQGLGKLLDEVPETLADVKRMEVQVNTAKVKVEEAKEEKQKPKPTAKVEKPSSVDKRGLAPQSATITVIKVAGKSENMQKTIAQSVLAKALKLKPDKFQIVNIEGKWREARPKEKVQLRVRYKLL
ncbi:MAG: hypothetical protein WC595_01085 [Candidatus Nanoarchaeia archaeon]